MPTNAKFASELNRETHSLFYQEGHDLLLEGDHSIHQLVDSGALSGKEKEWGMNDSTGSDLSAGLPSQVKS